MKAKSTTENGFESICNIALEDDKVFEFGNGLWKGKKEPFVKVNVLRNTNFNNDGTLSFDDVAELDVELKQFSNRRLIKEDIVLERSGGGPEQPVGRVVFFERDRGDYSFSNFTTRIRVKDVNKIKPKYLLYYLLYFYQNGGTYDLQQRTTGIRNLNFSDYKKILIPLLELPEQQKISSVLSKIQQVIELQGKIILTTKELKKSLMSKLFTEGLFGEEQKKTEIGLIPKSWDVVELGDICEQRKESIVPNGKGENKYIGLEHMVSGETWVKSFGYDNEVRSTKFIFNEQNLLYGKLRPYLDKAAVTDFSGVCSTDIIVLTPNKRTTRYFLVYFLHLNKFIEYTKATTSGVNHPRTSWNSLKKFNLALPTFPEQKEIADILLNIDKKLSQAEARKQTLQSLFKTMLNQLMTGKVRVKNLDIGVN